MNRMMNESTDDTTKGTAMNDDTTMIMPTAGPAADEEQTTPMPSVPLYATRPPAGMAGVSSVGTPGAGTAGQQPPQFFVQVPAQPLVKPEPLRKTGPSVPTIVLGVLGILLGCITLAFGFGFPGVSYALADWMVTSAAPETILALCMGGLGVLLLVIAAVWGVVRAVRNRHTADAGTDSTDTAEVTGSASTANSASTVNSASSMPSSRTDTAVL